MEVRGNHIYLEKNKYYRKEGKVDPGQSALCFWEKVCKSWKQFQAAEGYVKLGSILLHKDHLLIYKEFHLPFCVLRFQTMKTSFWNSLLLLFSLTVPHNFIFLPNFVTLLFTPCFKSRMYWTVWNTEPELHLWTPSTMRIYHLFLVYLSNLLYIQKPSG